MPEESDFCLIEGKIDVQLSDGIKLPMIWNKMLIILITEDSMPDKIQELWKNQLMSPKIAMENWNNIPLEQLPKPITVISTDMDTDWDFSEDCSDTTDTKLLIMVMAMDTDLDFSEVYSDVMVIMPYITVMDMDIELGFSADYSVVTEFTAIMDTVVVVSVYFVIEEDFSIVDTTVTLHDLSVQNL